MTVPLNLNTANIEIARRIQSDISWYQGFIDDVRIYNRALSAAEIKAIYEATK